MAGEGTDVRRAFDGPDIEHDDLIAFIDARNREDRERASSAGESRQRIGEYLDDTGMNGVALSFLRRIKKIADKSDGQNKAMDVIRSLKAGLKMVENDIAGQSTVDMRFEDVPEPMFDGDGLPEGDPSIAADADDFEQHLADIDADKVVSFR